MIHAIELFGQVVIAHSGLLLSIAGGCWLVAWALRDGEVGE
jgi:hypothetical protein